MTPGKYNIVIWRGGTWSIGITSEDIDFTDYTSFRMQIRPPWVKSSPTQSALLELTSANGRIVLEDGNSILRLTIPAVNTAALTFDEGAYELELVNGDVVDKLLYGAVTVKGELTV